MLILAMVAAVFGLLQMSLAAGVQSERNRNHSAQHHHRNNIGNSSIKQLSRSYSSHRCIGSQNDHRQEIGRACRFDNICLEAGTWVYHEPFLTTKLHDKSKGELTAFSHYGHPLVVLRAIEGPPFVPHIVIGKVTDNADRQSGMHFLFMPWAVVFNLGHNLWEELGYAYVTPRRFGAIDSRNIQVIQMVKEFGGPAWKKMMDGYLPGITNRPIAIIDDFIQQSKTRPICFDQVFVGGCVRLFMNDGIRGSETQLDGREEGFMGLRNAFLAHYGITPSLPPRPVIYISERLEPRRIHNILEVETFLKERFPSAHVLRVQWANMTVQQELELVSRGSILITPCGGISMNIPFLPDGAHAVIMDYPAKGKYLGFETGQSASMEISFWNRFPHVHKHYYQVRKNDTSSYVVDRSEPSNLRDFANIMIDLGRLEKIVIQALIDMMYMDENEQVIGRFPVQNHEQNIALLPLQNQTIPTLQLTVADKMQEPFPPGRILLVALMAWAAVIVVLRCGCLAVRRREQGSLWHAKP